MDQIEVIRKKIFQKIEQKSILILGFGREGRSSYYWFRKMFPDFPLAIADQNENIANESELQKDKNLSFFCNTNYLNCINQFDFVIKSPGISLKDISISSKTEISSQTDLFFYLFKNQTIGVTGTKGKSTTVSLLFHLIQKQHFDCLLVGNIGIPAFDIFEKITSKSLVVFELSSHQLQFVQNSPHISVLLNIFEEHLDHYNSYLEYQLSKFNIAKYQNQADYFIYNGSDQIIKKLFDIQKIYSTVFTFDYHFGDGHLIKNGFSLFNNNYSIEFSNLKVLGKHNHLNMCVALMVCEKLGFNLKKCMEDLKTFEPLPHRLEYVIECKGIKFYNDSISTIPEACIQAIETISNVGTLILGGFDRGIDYSKLINYLTINKIDNLILIGNVGEILRNELAKSGCTSNIFMTKNLDEVVDLAFNQTKAGQSCLLSPAASSYDMFKNFEERGNIFKEKVRQKCLTL